MIFMAEKKLFGIVKGLELSTSCSGDFPKSCSKKKKTFFGMMLKICKLYDKSKISKHFCAILRRNQRC